MMCFAAERLQGSADGCRVMLRALCHVEDAAAPHVAAAFWPII